MPLAAHPLFSTIPGAFTDALGELVSFTLAGGNQDLRAIVREEADELNDATAGSGTVGDAAYLYLATSDAGLIAEGDTLTYQSITFKIEFPSRDDGRGMTGFDLTRVV